MRTKNATARQDQTMQDQAAGGRSVRYTSQLFGSAHPDRDRDFARADAARAIKQVRVQAGLSRANFVSRLGVTLETLHNVEDGTADYQQTMDLCDRALMMFGPLDVRKEF